MSANICAAATILISGAQIVSVNLGSLLIVNVKSTDHLHVDVIIQNHLYTRRRYFMQSNFHVLISSKKIFDFLTKPSKQVKQHMCR